mgnify:CR=1 FL=1
MAETGGYTIYHAGDLNNWRWNGEDLAWNNNMSTNYRRELEKIKLPVSTRMLPWFR